MKYISTRGGPEVSATFEEALCSGYAPDGGLFVPDSLPSVDAEMLQQWSRLSFPELTRSVLRLFISKDEITDSELSRICMSSFDGFTRDCIIPVQKVGSLYVAELFHGPTFCFKDLGMRVVVNLLSHFCTRRKRKITLVVSTTGDTGPAAVQAVGDANNPLLTLLVHFPKGQISEFQRKQLTTVVSPCVRVAAFEGGGDDMDKPIKNMLTERSDMTGVNSYNIGRPLMQMVHYIWTYFRVADQAGLEIGKGKVDIVLPTGAMGNIAGGYMAKRMGVPLGKLCSGVNTNDITCRVINTGEYYKSDAMQKTLSEAINVQLPYNFERLLFYLTGCDHSLVKEWMTAVDETSKLKLSPDWLARLQQDFRSARVTDEEMCEIMRSVYEDHEYWMDPHTAVAFSAAQKLGYYPTNQVAKPVALLSTASPCKFREAVTVAMGEEGWNKYMEADFPPLAKQILDKPEIAPTIYEAEEGISLAEIQIKWEAIARQIAQNLSDG